MKSHYKNSWNLWINSVKSCKWNPVILQILMDYHILKMDLLLKILQFSSTKHYNIRYSDKL